jgi:hypothetical protein
VKFHAYLVGYDGIYDQTGLMPENRLLIGDYDGFSFPLTFKHEKQHKSLDIINTGTASLYLISDRMKSILENNHLTGWKVFPIKLIDKNENEISGYHGFSVFGTCGPITYDKCEIFEKRIMPHCPLVKYYKGLHIGLDKWDGTDFFLPEGTFWKIITEKTSDVLKKNKITNMRLENLADIELDIDVT